GDELRGFFIASNETFEEDKGSSSGARNAAKLHNPLSRRSLTTDSHPRSRLYSRPVNMHRCGQVRRLVIHRGEDDGGILDLESAHPPGAWRRVFEDDLGDVQLF